MQDDINISVGTDNELIEDSSPVVLDQVSNNSPAVVSSGSVATVVTEVPAAVSKAERKADLKADRQREKASSSNSVMGDVVKDILVEATKESVSSGRSDLRGITRDLTYMASADDLLGKDKFMKKYQAEQSDDLINNLKAEGKRQAILDASKKQESQNLKNQQVYNAFAPFFRDFMGIDRSFGIVPMSICLFFLFLPYLALSAVLNSVKFVLKGINAIFREVGGFEKGARGLALTGLCILLVIGFVVLLFLGFRHLLASLFGIYLFM